MVTVCGQNQRIKKIARRVNRRMTDRTKSWIVYAVILVIGLTPTVLSRNLLVFALLVLFPLGIVDGFYKKFFPMILGVAHFGWSLPQYFFRCWRMVHFSIHLGKIPFVVVCTTLPKNTICPATQPSFPKAG